MGSQLTQTLKTLKPLSSVLLKSLSTKSTLLEFDLHSSSVSASEVVVGIQLLEDAIHSIIVRRLEPNWLAFRPGSSYWVPPSRSIADKLAKIVGRISTQLSPQDSLSILDSRGWPSPSYFIVSDQVEGQSDSSISSRWVPPFGIANDSSVQRVGKLTETDPLTEEESLSVVCAHGWPSSSYFLDQGSPSLGEVQNSENVPLTEHDK